MGCCSSNDAVGDKPKRLPKIVAVPSGNEPITQPKTQRLPVKVEEEPKFETSEPPVIEKTTLCDDPPVVSASVTVVVEQQQPLAVLVVSNNNKPQPKSIDDDEETDEEEEDEEKEEEKKPSHQTNKIPVVVDERLHHTEPNPLIAKYITEFYDQCNKERQDKQMKLADDDISDGDKIVVKSALISLEEDHLKPVLDLVSDVLNQLHHARYAEEEAVPEREEDALKWFISSLRFSLTYPFMNTSSSLRLCLTKLVSTASSAKNVRFSIQDQIRADAALKHRAKLATQERLGHLSTFQRTASTFFDDFEGVLQNENVQNAVGTAIEFAKELPFIGSFIKPLVVIGKFCYERAKKLDAQQELAKQLLKEVERHVRRLARMDDLAELLFQDERDSDQRLSQAKESHGGAFSAVTALPQKDSSSTLEIAQALDDAQRIIARCFDAASSHDDKTNHWLDKLANFFVATDNTTLYEKLTSMLNDSMNELVKLVQDKVVIANSYRLKRMENLLEAIALNAANQQQSAQQQQQINNPDTPLIELLSDEEKRVLVKMLRSALASAYRARFHFSATIYKGASYWLDDFYVDVTCHSQSRESAQVANFLKNSSCNFVLLNSAAGNGKSIFLKRIAEMQLVNDDVAAAAAAAVTKPNGKPKKKKKSPPPYPSISIYLDLDSNEFKNCSGIQNNNLTDISTLLDTVLSSLKFDNSAGPAAAEGSNNKLVYKIRQNIKSLLRDIIIQQNVPITWLIDGYEKIAAKLQIRQDVHNDGNSVTAINTFFDKFATPNGRLRSKDHDRDLIRSVDSVVLAVRPEFVSEIAPTVFDEMTTDEAVEGRDYVSYILPGWSQEQATLLAERLYFAITREKNRLKIQEKAKLVLDSAHNTTSMTPRFVNLLSQCFMRQELMARTQNNIKNLPNKQQKQDLIDVVETYLDMSFSMNNLGSKVPAPHLVAVGEFVLEKFQNGEQFKFESDASIPWKVDFERAQLAGAGDTPTSRILFKDSPEFGELVAALYLRQNPSRIGDLNWDANNSGIWMNVAKYIFTNKIGDSQKIIDEFTYKFSCSYDYVRADVEDVIAENFGEMANQLTTFLKQYRGEDDGSTLGGGGANNNNASFAAQTRSRRGFSVIDNKYSTSGTFEPAQPQTADLKFAWLHFQKSVHYALRDPSRFSELQDRCHCDLLSDLLLLVEKHFGERQSEKKILLYLSDEHKKNFPSDPRPSVPPFFLWLINLLSRSPTSKRILKCIDEDYFSNFDKHPMPGGFDKNAASLTQYNPIKGFGINFAQGHRICGDYDGAPPIRLPAKQLAKKLAERMTQYKAQKNPYDLTSSSGLRASTLGGSGGANAAGGGGGSSSSALGAVGRSYTVEASSSSLSAETYVAIWNMAIIAFYENVDEHRELSDSEKIIVRDFIQYLKDHGAQLKFVEAVRLSRKSRAPVDLAFKEDRPNITLDHFLAALHLCFNKKSAVLTSCLLENAGGMQIPTDDLIHAIELVAEQQHLLDVTKPKKVDLSNCHLNTKIDRVVLVARAIRKFTLLEELNLADNNLDIMSLSALVLELFAPHPPSRTQNLHPVTLKSLSHSFSGNENLDTAGVASTITGEASGPSSPSSHRGRAGTVILTFNPEFTNSEGSAMVNVVADDSGVKHDVPLPNLKFINISQSSATLGSFLVAATAILNRNSIAKIMNRQHEQVGGAGRSKAQFFSSSTLVGLWFSGLAIGAGGNLQSKIQEPAYYKEIRNIVDQGAGFFSPTFIEKVLTEDFADEKLLILKSTKPPSFDEAYPYYFYEGIANVLQRSAKGVARQIDLSHTQIGGQNLKCIFENNRLLLLKNLMILELEDCGLGINDSVGFFNLLASQVDLKIDTLRLSKNGLAGAACCTALKNLLLHLRGTLYSLDLSDNDFGTDLVSQILCSTVQQQPLLKTLTKLSKLNIGYNNLSTEKKDHTSHLLLEVCQCCPDSIRTLDFASCGVTITNNQTDRGWTDFLRERVSKNWLRTFDISGNNSVHNRFCTEWSEIWKKAKLDPNELRVPKRESEEDSIATKFGIGVADHDSRIAQYEQALNRGSAAAAARSSAASPHSSNVTSYQIREVETWENWRWYPIRGWTQSLLPTDRFQYSSKDGKRSLPKDSFKGYDWAGDWEIDIDPPNNSDQHGWTYARDFTATFYPASFFGECVRRRRWVRKFKFAVAGPSVTTSGMGSSETTEGFTLV